MSNHNKATGAVSKTAEISVGQAEGAGARAGGEVVGGGGAAVGGGKGGGRRGKGSGSKSRRSSVYGDIMTQLDGENDGKEREIVSKWEEENKRLKENESEKKAAENIFDSFYSTFVFPWFAFGATSVDSGDGSGSLGGLGGGGPGTGFGGVCGSVGGGVGSTGSVHSSANSSVGSSVSVGSGSSSDLPVRPPRTPSNARTVAPIPVPASPSYTTTPDHSLTGTFSASNYFYTSPSTPTNTPVSYTQSPHSTTASSIEKNLTHSPHTDHEPHNTPMSDASTSTHRRANTHKSTTPTLQPCSANSKLRRRKIDIMEEKRLMEEIGDIFGDADSDGFLDCVSSTEISRKTACPGNGDIESFDFIEGYVPQTAAEEGRSIDTFYAISTALPVGYYNAALRQFCRVIPKYEETTKKLKKKELIDLGRI